jgi:hypothetical protein
MSFSLANGFSDGALTPTRALAAGLFIGGAVIVSMWTYGSLSRWLERDPTVAPACYGAERANHHTAGTKAVPGNPADRRDRLWWNPRGELYVERMVATGYICTAQSCDREALKQYRSALFWYLSERMQRTRQLDSAYGDKGLERARLLFGGKADLDIERDLRERYNAGVFHIKDFRQNKDAITILLLAGGKALRPCRAVAGRS